MKLCRDAQAPIMFLTNPKFYLNIESSHWILELETTSQHRSWWLWIRFVTTLDGNQPWIIPGFVSSASPFFLCPPPESQRWTYPSLQNLQTAEKLHIRGERQQKREEEKSPCCRHLFADPRAKLSWDQCWISMVEPKTLATHCKETPSRSPDRHPHLW